MLSARSHSEPADGCHLKVQAVPRRRWLRRGGPPLSPSPRAPLPEPPAPSPRLPGLGARCGQQHRGPFPAASEAPRSKCWFPETSCGSRRLSQPGCSAPEHAAPPRVLYSRLATRSLSAPFLGFVPLRVGLQPRWGRGESRRGAEEEVSQHCCCARSSAACLHPVHPQQCYTGLFPPLI